MKQIYQRRFYSLIFEEYAWGLYFYGFAPNPRRSKFFRSKKRAYPTGRKS